MIKHIPELSEDGDFMEKDTVETVNEAVEYIKEQIPSIPETALILGSGLGAFVESMEDRIYMEYSIIPYWPVSTAPGHAGNLVYGKIEGIPVLVMQGRIHPYEGYGMEKVTFPVRVLGELGTERMIITNASGGINYGYNPGDLVLIYDHINFQGRNPLTGPNVSQWGPRFPDMTYAYDPELMDLASQVASKAGIQLKKGVYIAFSGPSYETPAEIRMARVMGADLAGMSTVPEVIVANHMNIKVCAISCVANYAAGITSNRLSEKEVLDEMSRTSSKLVTLLKEFLVLLERSR